MKLILSAASERRYGTRGAVYRLMRSSYREMATCLVQDEPSWRDIADAMTKAGVVGRDGNPPNRKSLPRVWHRVCQDVAAEEAMRLTGIRPSKAARRQMPANWRPSGFAQPNAPSPSGVEHQGSPSTALATVPLQQPVITATATPATVETPHVPGGSYQRVLEMMNTRSSRKPNGDPT